tara:strand:- start:216 stop:1223 length:1008 start_codon:yes stop_codon:yes gene_type:complete
MRLKGSGDCHFPNASAFGIGTDNATHLLELVRSSTDFGPTLEINNTSSANGSTGSIRFVTESESTGLIIGKHSSGHGTADLSFINQELNADLAISTNNTERMRIDSSGNLLVNTTTSSTLNEGFRVIPGGSGGGTLVECFNNSGGTALLIGRGGSDGTMVDFRRGSSVCGIIGTVDGDMFLGTGDANLRFTDAGDGVRPATSAGADFDDHADLGAASARFNNLFLVNNPTVGSDKNLKQDIEDITETEKKVAVKAKALLKKYKYKNSVTDKGNKARIHFGIIAQELQDAFSSEGLDAYDYSMFCSDTWTDQTTGEEKTQLGIRYTELLAFIIAAI